MNCPTLEEGLVHVVNPWIGSGSGPPRPLPTWLLKHHLSNQAWGLSSVVCAEICQLLATLEPTAIVGLGGNMKARYES